jgi:hypothetical protein
MKSLRAQPLTRSDKTLNIRLNLEARARSKLGRCFGRTAETHVIGRNFTPGGRKRAQMGESAKALPPNCTCTCTRVRVRVPVRATCVAVYEGTKVGGQVTFYSYEGSIYVYRR